MSQSNLMWSTVYASPSIAGGFFVAWYSVLFSCNWVLPFLISMFGFICMVFQTAIVWRMSEYNGALFLNIKDKIPHRPAVWKISGKHLAKSVSLTLCCVFIALIGYSFEFSDNCKSSQNVFSNFLTQLFAN